VTGGRLRPLLSEDHDPVRIRAAPVVVNAPAVRGFCERLGVDERLSGLFLLSE